MKWSKYDLGVRTRLSGTKSLCTHEEQSLHLLGNVSPATLHPVHQMSPHSPPSFQLPDFHFTCFSFPNQIRSHNKLPDPPDCQIRCFYPASQFIWCAVLVLDFLLLFSSSLLLKPLFTWITCTYLTCQTADTYTDSDATGILFWLRKSNLGEQGFMFFSHSEIGFIFLAKYFSIYLSLPSLNLLISRARHTGCRAPVVVSPRVCQVTQKRMSAIIGRLSTYCASC